MAESQSFSRSTPPPKSNSQRQLVPAGTEERWINVHGRRMRYLTGGSGPPLLLIHGLMGFSFSWSENLTALKDHFTVLAPDLPNSGYSERCATASDLRSNAALLSEFMHAVNVARADVLGSSYGGTLAMALAAYFADRVRRLVLVSPSHCGSEHSRWQARLFSLPGGLLAARCLRFAPPWFYGYFITRMYGVPARMLPGTVRNYAAPLRVRGTSLHAAKIMRCWKANFQTLEGLMPLLCGVPALLFWGDEDRVVPIATSSELIQHFSKAKLRVIPTAGHLPYEELPQEFNAAVIEFLLEQDAAADVAGFSRPSDVNE